MESVKNKSNKKEFHADWMIFSRRSRCISGGCRRSRADFRFIDACDAMTRCIQDSVLPSDFNLSNNFKNLNVQYCYLVCKWGLNFLSNQHIENQEVLSERLQQQPVKNMGEH